jgi:transposase
MKTVTTIGLDVAKNNFQLHGVNTKGDAILRTKLTRGNLLPFFVNLPACLVGIEACCGAHHWAREITKLGHTVKLIPPQYVKPFVKTHKNDAKDAEAICEAVTRPNMHFVSIKTIEKQDIQFVHRVRERLVGERTALVNQIRGFLAEIGIALPQGITNVRQHLPELTEDVNNVLTGRERDLFSDLYTELVELDQKIKKYARQLQEIAKQNEACKRLTTIPGVGPITSTALVAAVGDIKDFKNGRQFAAWLGLVPRQHSSGGKTRLLGISKWGNIYLRKLLIHGARAVLLHASKKEGPKWDWLRGVVGRRGKHKAIVALANKTARVIWVVLARNESWRGEAATQTVSLAGASS